MKKNYKSRYLIKREKGNQNISFLQIPQSLVNNYYARNYNQLKSIISLTRKNNSKKILTLRNVLTIRI